MVRLHGQRIKQKQSRLASQQKMNLFNNLDSSGSSNDEDEDEGDVAETVEKRKHHPLQYPEFPKQCK